MTSDGETAKTKVVDLKKLYNFVVDYFFIWIHLVKEKYVWISHILNLNFSNNLGWRNSKNESCTSQNLNNFIVDYFLIWIRLESQTLILSLIEYNMRRNIYYRHKRVWGAAVRAEMREAKVAGSNPSHLEALEKMPDLRACGCPVGPYGIKKNFCYFFA